MSAPVKASRNRQRKQAYSAQADAGSRNQHTIDGPIVGQLVWVTRDEDGRSIRPYQRVVHHTETSATAETVIPRAPKREPKAQRARRQHFAWDHCAALRRDGVHDLSGKRGDGDHRSDRCITCGCPAERAS